MGDDWKMVLPSLQGLLLLPPPMMPNFVKTASSMMVTANTTIMIIRILDDSYHGTNFGSGA